MKGDSGGTFGESVAIIGAGASGALLASQILRRAEPGTNVVLIDRSGRFGPGLAYGSGSDAQLLNVGAIQMAPLPKDPNAFFRWSQKRRPRTQPSDYLPRHFFGEFLSDLLDDCERRVKGAVNLERCHDEVVKLMPPADGGKCRVGLKSGRSFEVDYAILALGNAPPRPPSVLPRSLIQSEYFLADPWGSDRARVRTDETVLLLGTGLTMVDVALDLGVSGGPVLHAISPSGLLPREHQPGPPPLPSRSIELSARPELDRLVTTLMSEAIAAVGRGDDWRTVIDSMRPVSNQLWERMDRSDQARFESELAQIWSVHRNRMAPKVAAALNLLREKGRLRVKGASIEATSIRDGAVDVDLVTTEPKNAMRLRVSRIINCAGPVHDPQGMNSALVRDLMRRGSVRANHLGTGFDTNSNGIVLGQDGTAIPRFYAIGPLRTGSLFETTAIPEIAQQARAIATEITGNMNLRPSRPRATATHSGIAAEPRVR